MTAETVDLLTPQEAYTIASQWASCVTTGDPGAVFYSFSRDDAQPRGEAHRAALLTYTESLLADDDLEADDRAELEALKLFFERFPHSGEEFRETYQERSQALIDTADDFARGYMEAAVWLGAELPEGHPDADSDKNNDLTPADLAPETILAMLGECIAFRVKAGDLLTQAEAREGYSAARAGHDFWLTRNGHGAGFWDRDELEADDLGDKLSEVAKAFGESNLYQGDDGGIYEM